MNPAALGLIGTIIAAAFALAGVIAKMRADASTAATAKTTADREHLLALETIRQKAAVELEAARARLAVVDGPATNAEAWSSVFEVTHRTMLSLQADVARLEQRINDQDHEHRLELDELATRGKVREMALEHTADSLRRLRSYTSVITTLLAEHGIAFPPPPPDVEQVAPERRNLTARGVVTAIIDPRATTDATRAEDA